MAFIQIIEARSSRFDDVRALSDEWYAATEGKRTATRSIVAQDRNDPQRHVIIVFFDSYEDAMANSNLPETAAFAEKQMALYDGPPTFTDLDVIDDRS